MSEVSAAEAYAAISDLFGGPKLTVSQAAVAMHESKLKVQTDLTARLAAEQKAAARETEAAESVQREDALAQATNYYLADQLREIHEKTWPDEITLAAYAAAARRFSLWCRECGVGFLPAQGAAVGAYLVDLIVDSEFSMTAADLRQHARAIEFTHDLAKHYLDRAPAAAALMFIQKCRDQDETDKLNPDKGDDHADETGKIQRQ